MTSSNCSSFQRTNTAASSGDGGRGGPGRPGPRRPPTLPSALTLPKATPRGNTAFTHVGASQKERLFCSSNQKKPQNIFFLSNALADRGLWVPSCGRRLPRTQRGHPHAAGLAQPAPLSQASAPRPGALDTWVWACVQTQVALQQWEVCREPV